MNHNLSNISELIKTKKYKKAQTILKKALNKSPLDSEILRTLGVVVLHMNNYNMAEIYFLKSYKINPTSPQVLLNLASLYRLKLDFPKAIEYINSALIINPDSVAAIYNYANLLRANAQYEEAEKLYLRVLDLNKNHFGALVNIGHLSKNNGKINQASKYYHNALTLNPNDGSMYWALANLKKYSFTEYENLQIDSLLKNRSINPIPLLFAKTKILEDKNLHQESFTFLIKGNQLKYKSLNREPNDWVKYTKNLKAIFSKKYIEKLTGSGNPSTQPIFIVSMPRAGSTLIEQILASHTRVTGAAELPYIPSLIQKYSKHKSFPDSFNGTNPDKYHAFGDEYINLAKRWTINTDYFTDKLPDNLTYLGVILLSMPNAKVIYSVRNPLDVCLSCYRQLFAHGNEWSYDLNELAQYHQHHVNIMEHWCQMFPNRIITIQYENLVNNTKSNIENILKFCNLDWQDECLDFHKTKRNIRTASAGQVTEKINTNGLNRYKKYGNKLNHLDNLLNGFVKY